MCGGHRHGIPDMFTAHIDHPIARGPPPYRPPGWTDDDPDFHAYVVQVCLGDAPMALRGIAELGICAWNPQFVPAKRPVKQPLFRSYIFTQFTSNSPYHWIYRTRGVVTILGTYERPTSIPAEAMLVLFSKCSADGVTYEAPPKDLEPGTPVRFADGPFAELEGIVKWSNAERCGVLMRLLGSGQRMVISPRRWVESV